MTFVHNRVIVIVLISSWMSFLFQKEIWLNYFEKSTSVFVGMGSYLYVNLRKKPKAKTYTKRLSVLRFYFLVKSNETTST